VLAVEIDGHLVPILQEVMSSAKNVRIIQGDILELNPVELMTHSNFIVVANIPYFITSAIIRHCFQGNRNLHGSSHHMQKEVAERICAKPGDLSLLALSVQVFGNPVIGFSIPAASF
jgi:16S rRNA (adenine1518-N6/adenine1519-N6)-dimethyltransferase